MTPHLNLPSYPLFAILRELFFSEIIIIIKLGIQSSKVFKLNCAKILNRKWSGVDIYNSGRLIKLFHITLWTWSYIAILAKWWQTVFKTYPMICMNGSFGFGNVFFRWIFKCLKDSIKCIWNSWLFLSV